MLDADALRHAFDGVEVVFHLAAKISIAGDPDGSVRAINVDGVRNAATAALDTGVRRFVHVSSIHAFDCEQPGVIDETSARAVRPSLPAYDRSKAAGEVALHTVIDRGLDAVIANLTGVIGPYDFTPSRMGAVFVALGRGKFPATIGGGFDWVDARDVASSLLVLEVKGRTGENYLLPGHRASFATLAKLAANVTGRPGAPVHDPDGRRQARRARGALVGRAHRRRADVHAGVAARAGDRPHRQRPEGRPRARPLPPPHPGDRRRHLLLAPRRPTASDPPLARSRFGVAAGTVIWGRSDAKTLDVPGFPLRR